MADTNERWAAASGFGMLLAAAAAVTLERGAGIEASAPAEVTVDLFANNRELLLAQSLLFVVSTGFFVLFVSALRSFLIRAEGGTGVLATTVFGAGLVWAAISLVAQAVQVALAMAFVDDVPTAVAGPMSDLMFAVLTIANIPIGVMLIATAVVSLQTKAFPAWLGWLSVGTAAAHLAAAFGIVAGSGPLSPGGSVSYMAYVLMVAWILATTIVMIRRIGHVPAEAARLPADGSYGPVISRSSGLS
jgi:hypothetical protein